MKIVIGMLALFASTTFAWVDCEAKAEQVLVDTYQIGWKMSNWAAPKLICQSSGPQCSSVNNLNQMMALMLSASTTGNTVIIRYGTASSCTDAVVTSGTDLGYYYRLKAN